MLEAAIRGGAVVITKHDIPKAVLLHIARIRVRVARGGHHIPENTIRERYERSRVNLIRLLPLLTELRLFDNSVDADPASSATPTPLLVLHTVNGTIAATCDLPRVPGWAKAIVAAKMRSANAK